MHHLNSLLVLIEIYGVPDWKVDLHITWPNIRSRAVLSYLISNGLPVSGALVERALHTCITEDRDEMVLALLKMKLVDIEYLLHIAIPGGHLGPFLLLLSELKMSSVRLLTAIVTSRSESADAMLAHMLASHTYTYGELLDVMRSAIGESNLPAFRILFSRLRVSNMDRVLLIEDALACNSLPILLDLVRGHESLVAEEMWHTGLRHAIKQGNEDIVDYILGEIELDATDSDLLEYTASHTVNGNFFPAFLKDERLDPMRVIDRLVYAIAYDIGDTENLNILIQSERVSLDEMSCGNLALIYDTLLDTDDETEIIERVNVFLSQSDVEEEQLRDLVLSSSVVRDFILLGRTTGIDENVSLERQVRDRILEM